MTESSNHRNDSCDSSENSVAKLADLKKQLLQQKKITAALLRRVKTNLKYQVYAGEVFERNVLLKDEIKKTKKQLYDQAETSQKLVYLARHDSLTGLVNRHEFESQLKQAVLSVQRNAGTHALCFLDLDQFKVVNDTSGHLAGDEMLKQLSVILKEHIRDGDKLARLGGDEFGLLLENCSLSQVKGKIEAILSLVDGFRFPWDQKVFRVSVSAGISIIDRYASSHIDSLKQADIACYAAKNAGRNRFHVYQAKDLDLNEQSDQMMWVPTINEALEKHRFRLYVQAIKPSDPRLNYLHYEVLVRLKEENGNIVPPGAFLPTAERYNLITKIDYWVIGQVFDWLNRHARQLDPNTHFSINLSGQTLGDEKALSYISKQLESGKVAPSIIQFEVTETMAISNLQVANHFIKSIKSYGCGFSLDDFGSGLSSFGYLKNLAVDTLKIDGIFVRDILDDPIDAAMVDSINTIGHVMGLKTIAEFVENQAIADKLIELGVDYLQGYGIAKPVPIDQILIDK
ncbi:MAG: EAL domain-containing protein [Enterobacterales bacterium]|nr:EAL domain-containing protein [Enterobacterales bacterium]